MNVLVIENEKTKAEKVKDLLFKFDETIRIVGITKDILSAAEWLSQNRVPDIILANSSVLSEIELKIQKEVQTLVTINAGSEEFNFRAFRYKTIRDVLPEKILDTNEKPLIIDEGGESISRNYSNDSFRQRFLVKQGQKLLSVPVEQIAYFFSEDRFIFFRTFDNQKFLLEYRIEQLENILSPGRFFRVNRSFIISLPSVKEIHAYFGHRLKLYLAPSVGREVIVSRKRVAEFKEWLGK